VVTNGHRSAHKEYKKLAIWLVRDNFTTKIDYKSENIVFTTTCMSNKIENFNTILFFRNDDTNLDKKNQVFYRIVLLWRNFHGIVNNSVQAKTKIWWTRKALVFKSHWPQVIQSCMAYS
jgi:hypothetical protein